MHVPNFKLKNSVKTLLYKLQFVRDFFVLHPLREMQRIALADSVAYIREKMPLAVGLVNEREMFDMAFDRMPGEGLLLEFGVHKGGTINHAAERNPGREVHGFDSFRGLPGDWTGVIHPKGAFDRKGKAPSVRSNVRLHKGLFSDTLPGWIAQNRDLYDSTRDVFDVLGPHLSAGTTIDLVSQLSRVRWAPSCTQISISCCTTTIEGKAMTRTHSGRVSAAAQIATLAEASTKVRKTT
jgi:hypothetical protein